MPGDSMTTPEMSEVPQAAPSVRDFSRGGSGVVRPIARDARARELRRAPYPALVGAVLQRASRFSVAAWDRALRDVRRVQESQLLALLDHAKDTEFGRAHGFAGIRSYEDYVKQVPVGDYDSFSPFIDRMRKGEQNLLVPEFVRWFGNSSGSSNHGKPKFLPITMRQVKQQQRAGTDTVMRYLDSSGNAEMFGGGFTLGLFPPITMREEGPVLITSNPALMSTQMPAIARPCYLPDDEVKRIASYEEKLEVVAKKYFDWNVAAVTGTTCWFTLLFDKVLAEAKRRGHPARCVADVWPNLRVLIGGGVSAGPYLPIIREMVGHEVTLVDT